jgi:imidazolonepropionase-like amidohydrolase
MLRWEDKVGSLQAGRYADIIGVIGNPLDDLSLLEFPVFVMKGGKVIDLDK